MVTIVKEQEYEQDKIAFETKRFKILWEYLAQLYANNCQNLDEIGNSSGKHNLSNLITMRQKV